MSSSELAVEADFNNSGNFDNSLPYWKEESHLGFGWGRSEPLVTSTPRPSPLGPPDYVTTFITPMYYGPTIIPNYVPCMDWRFAPHLQRSFMQPQYFDSVSSSDSQSFLQFPPPNITLPSTSRQNLTWDHSSSATHEWETAESVDVTKTHLLNFVEAKPSSKVDSTGPTFTERVDKYWETFGSKNVEYEYVPSSQSYIIKKQPEEETDLIASSPPKKTYAECLWKYE